MKLEIIEKLKRIVAIKNEINTGLQLTKAQNLNQERATLRSEVVNDVTEMIDLFNDAEILLLFMQRTQSTHEIKKVIANNKVIIQIS